MKCWKCGQEISDGMRECVYCHADQQRSVPVTDVGRALRQLYDRYGADSVLTNPVLLSNGLGDVISDTLSVNLKKVKNQLRSAMDAGIGRLYLEQIRGSGPDGTFDARIMTLLTEDAGLSDKAAADLMGWFDEMIGWKAPKAEPPQDPPVIEKRSKEAEIFNKAMAAMHQNTLSGYRDALDLFEQIPDYSNAGFYAKICRQKIQEMIKPKPPEPEQKTDGNGDSETVSSKVKWGVAAAIVVLLLILWSNHQNQEIKTMQTAQTQAALVQKIPTNTPKLTNTKIPTEKPKEISAPKVGDIIKFGRYEQDKWSGPDEIEWQVLTVEDGRALLLSVYGLETKKYNEEYADVTWETCSLRSWLNGTFYNTAFSTEEKGQIAEVWNSNSDEWMETSEVKIDDNVDVNSVMNITLPNGGIVTGDFGALKEGVILPDGSKAQWYGAKRHRMIKIYSRIWDTKDRILLLSIDEVEKYLPTEASRQCEATYHAKQNGAFVNVLNGKCWWWMRSPGYSNDRAAYVNAAGNNFLESNKVSDNRVTIRPAFWLNL